MSDSVKAKARYLTPCFMMIPRFVPALTWPFLLQGPLDPTWTTAPSKIEQGDLYEQQCPKNAGDTGNLLMTG